MKKHACSAAISFLALAATSGTAISAAPANVNPHVMQPAFATRAATPEVVALFTAASEGDEANFTRLLGKMGNPNGLGVNGDTLLHVLLKPAASLQKSERDWTGEEGHDRRDHAHWLAQRARHTALLPAKTRMLALALQRGAAVNAGDRDCEVAALHLAATFGTREMVDMLLGHGADAGLACGARGLTPLEYALDLTASGIQPAELITVQERTAIVLALLAANPERPYLRRETPGKQHSADFHWNALLQLTAGSAVLDKMASTGTTPYAGDTARSPYAYAAEAGNAEAIGWLKTRVPRFDKSGRDRWLDAAMWALYLPPAQADAVLTQLLVKDMPWPQDQLHSDIGFARELPMQSKRGLPGSNTTILGHAVRSGRADWVARLVALGAQLSPGGEKELAEAVAQGNPATVTLLLGMGADPLKGTTSALERALYVERYPAEYVSEYGVGRRLPPQATVVLPLLVNHIVTVQKQSLAQMTELTRALQDPVDADGAARVRLLLSVGFPARDIDAATGANAFTAQDRALAGELLDRGMFTQAPGQPRADTSAIVLLKAVDARRTDLLPRLLKMGFDPNLRRGGDPSPVDHAIRLGAADALAMLLAAGGRIDYTVRDARGGALDQAVASRSEAMLRQVSGNPARSLGATCVPDSEALTTLVLNAPDGYWNLLRQQGFGGDAKACPDQARRVIMTLADTPSRILAGWSGNNLRVRLPQLGSRGDVRATLDDAVWSAVGQTGNDTLRRLVLQAGWQPPPAPVQSVAARAADVALRKRLPGMYEVPSMRELGSSIVLRGDGSFSYGLVYGGVDESAEGHWEVRDGRVVFSSAADTPPLFLLQARPGAKPEGEVVVTLDGRHGDEKISVFLLGDAPPLVRAQPGPDGWTARLPGPVRQIVLRPAQASRQPPLVVEVPERQALAGTFLLTPNRKSGAGQHFNFTMQLQNGELVWERDEMTLRYQKTTTPAP